MKFGTNGVQRMTSTTSSLICCAEWPASKRMDTLPVSCVNKSVKSWIREQTQALCSSIQLEPAHQQMVAFIPFPKVDSVLYHYFRVHLGLVPKYQRNKSTIKSNKREIWGKNGSRALKTIEDQPLDAALALIIITVGQIKLWHRHSVKGICLRQMYKRQIHTLPRLGVRPRSLKIGLKVKLKEFFF